MGLNNWGGITEHMYKKPRAVFGNKKMSELTSKELAKSKLEIEEDKILKSKRRRLVMEIFVWYVIPLFFGVVVFLS